MNVTCNCGKTFHTSEGSVECFSCGRKWFQPNHKRAGKSDHPILTGIGLGILKHATTSRPNKECWSCNGTGRYHKYTCNKCGGSGIYDPRG